MKKIGLLTFHDTTNFGSWLQTYSLYKKVKDLGYRIEVINYICEGIEFREKISIDKLSYMPLDSIVLQLKKQLCFKYYLRHYMKLSRKYNKKSIYKSKKKYDLFLLGSDLVWDLNITYGDLTYLFDFLNDETPRIAFAASSGRDCIPVEQREVFKCHLQKFNNIAVREDSMCKDIGNLFNKRVEHVCDPTMLLKVEDWKLFLKDRVIKEKYVLLYFVDGKGNLSRLAKKYARENGYKLVAINRDFNISKDNLINPVSIKEYITHIFYAEKIFTASYHGMMFSLIFNKQFSFYPFAPSTRMISVAKKYGLEDYNICSKKYDLNKDIVYDNINPLIEKFRDDSLKCLKRMLNEVV